MGTLLRMMILHRILREFLQEERVPKPVSDSLVAELQRSYRSARVDSREKAEELETESALLVCHAFEDLYDEYIKCVICLVSPWCCRFCGCE